MSNKRKDELLGQPHGTANAKLRKAIIFDLANRCGAAFCYRCGGTIESLSEFSIEHKTAWQAATDPRAAFFDLDNIAFSHLRCNIGAKQKPATCAKGHPFTPENRLGYACRECSRRKVLRQYYERGYEARRLRRGDVRRYTKRTIG